MGTRKRRTEAQIIGILKEVEAGAQVKDVCRREGVSEQSYYRWKSKYGGMDVSDAEELKRLEVENSRLKRLVANQALDIDALKLLLGKKVVTVSMRREAVTVL